MVTFNARSLFLLDSLNVLILSISDGSTVEAMTWLKYIATKVSSAGIYVLLGNFSSDFLCI